MYRRDSIKRKDDKIISNNRKSLCIESISHIDVGYSTLKKNISDIHMITYQQHNHEISLWKSLNGKLHKFESINNTIPNVQSVCTQPYDPSIYYVGTAYGDFYAVTAGYGAGSKIEAKNLKIEGLPNISIDTIIPTINMNNQCFIVQKNRCIHLVDIETSKIIRKFEYLHELYKDVSWNYDLNCLITSESGYLYYWDPRFESMDKVDSSINIPNIHSLDSNRYNIALSSNNSCYMLDFRYDGGIRKKQNFDNLKNGKVYIVDNHSIIHSGSNIDLKCWDFYHY